MLDYSLLDDFSVPRASPLCEVHSSVFTGIIGHQLMLSFFSPLFLVVAQETPLPPDKWGFPRAYYIVCRDDMIELAV